MFEDALQIISKIFCVQPLENNDKIYMLIILTFYVFLSGYVRIYTSILNFLAETGKLSLTNYIYLGNATLSIFIICVQILSRQRQKQKVKSVLKKLMHYQRKDEIKLLGRLRLFQCVFLFAIFAILFAINMIVHEQRSFTMMANALNETLIEAVSFLDTFFYFNHVYLAYIGFKRMHKIDKNYLILCDLCRDIDLLHRLNISAVIGFVFLWTTFDAYMFFNVLLNESNKTWKSFIRSFPWFWLHTFKLIIILIAPPKCVKEAERIGKQLTANFEISVRTLNRHVEFWAYHKWFKIEPIFLISMFGTIATYLAIIYQFSEN